MLHGIELVMVGNLARIRYPAVRYARSIIIIIYFYRRGPMPTEAVPFLSSANGNFVCASCLPWLDKNVGWCEGIGILP